MPPRTFALVVLGRLRDHLAKPVRPESGEPRPIPIRGGGHKFRLSGRSTNSTAGQKVRERVDREHPDECTIKRMIGSGNEIRTVVAEQNLAQIDRLTVDLVHDRVPTRFGHPQKARDGVGDAMSVFAAELPTQLGLRSAVTSELRDRQVPPGDSWGPARRRRVYRGIAPALTWNPRRETLARFCLGLRPFGEYWSVVARGMSRGGGRNPLLFRPIARRAFRHCSVERARGSFRLDVRSQGTAVGN